MKYCSLNILSLSSDMNKDNPFNANLILIELKKIFLQNGKCEF